MSDDFVLNVRQIAQYPLTPRVDPNDVLIVQKGGLGGPYMSMLPFDLMSTAMLDGGFIQFALNGGVVWNDGNGVPRTGITSDGVNIVFDAPLAVPSLHSTGDIFVNGIALANQIEVTQLFDSIVENSVLTFNGRKGIVQLNEADILRAGGILQNNPHFTGVVLVPTVWDFRQNDDTAASTAWVQFVLQNLLCSGSVVTSFNGRGGDVTLTADDITAASTAQGVYPRANTPPLGDTSTRIATTAFVDGSIADLEATLIQQVQNAADLQLVNYALLNSPQFVGIPTAPTANPGSSTGQLATTAFVHAAVTAATAGVASFNTRTGAVVLIGSDITAAGGALLASPTFTGNPLAPTQAPGTSNTTLATTAFVAAAVAAGTAGVTSFNTRTGAVSLQLSDVTGAGGAPLASPIFTGTPAAPTASPGTSTTQLATTAFVAAALAAVGGVVSFNSRTGAITLQGNDISGAGGALVNSPTFTGTPAAPTAAPGTSTTQIATTAFVTAAISAGNVTSFNGRVGAVTLNATDIANAGGAPLNSPAFSGSPTAPTASAGTNNTQVATTAFVMNALGGSVVSTFNGRSGAVTLSVGDITGAGGAPLASPALTGTPTAPTAAPGNNTTQLATTAFVQAALGGGGVVNTFNGRSGAVSLLAADVSAAGGALLASPSFTGTPTAPTAVTGTASNQLATCQFVLNELGTLGGVTSFNGRAGVVTLGVADIVGAQGAAYLQQDAAPATGANNTLWYNSLNGNLYVQYKDPVSSAYSWVIANNPPAPQVTYSANVYPGAVGTGTSGTGQTTASSFTTPANSSVNTIWKIRQQAAGGGGGGTQSPASFAASGGGGGEFKEYLLSGIAANTPITMTLGNGGQWGVYNVATPGAGGATTLNVAATGTTIACGGGQPGVNTATVWQYAGIGGRNGVTTPGSATVTMLLQRNGGNGGPINGQAVMRSDGGDSHLGSGLRPMSSTGDPGFTDVSPGYGAGGGGAFAAGAAGWGGGRGVIIIERIAG